LVRITVISDPRPNCKTTYEKAMGQYISRGHSYEVSEEVAEELKDRDFIRVEGKPKAKPEVPEAKAYGVFDKVKPKKSKGRRKKRLL